MKAQKETALQKQARSDDLNQLLQDEPQWASFSNHVKRFAMGNIANKLCLEGAMPIEKAAEEILICARHASISTATVLNFAQAIRS